MKNERPSNTSQDYDRKHGKDHITENPRAGKNGPDRDHATKPFPEVDKREIAREEHSNHFTNRSPDHNS